MDLDEFERRVRSGLDQARDSLARIEEQVREKGEIRALMETSRAYAQFCLHAREYLHGVSQRRPLPRRLAEKLADVAQRLQANEDALHDHDLHPSPAELAQLIRDAESLAQRA